MEFFDSIQPQSTFVGVPCEIRATISRAITKEILSESLMFEGDKGGGVGEVIRVSQQLLYTSFNFISPASLEVGQYTIRLVLGIKDDVPVEIRSRSADFNVGPKKPPRAKTQISSIQPNEVTTDESRQHVFKLIGQGFDAIDDSKPIQLVPQPSGFSPLAFRFLNTPSGNSVMIKCTVRIPPGPYRLKVGCKNNEFVTSVARITVTEE